MERILYQLILVHHQAKHIDFLAVWPASISYASQMESSAFVILEWGGDQALLCSSAVESLYYFLC